MAARSPSGRSRTVVAMSTPRSGSMDSTLMVPGTLRSCSAMTVAKVSSAPAPPSRCPVIDLVPLTITDDAWSPSACWMEVASVMSPFGVEVAWALMCLMSVGRRWDSTSARFMASICP